MSDQNLNKRFFTEADSPVPLIPADMAWDNMQQKLDQPEKKKRRFIIWIPPMGCMLLVVLLTGAAAIMWYGLQKERVTTRKPKYTAAVSIPYSSQTANSLNKQPVTQIKIKENIPTLTAYNQNKRSVYAKTPEKRRRTVKENATGGGYDEQSLPFAFPERVAFTDPILVQAYLPLPSLFHKPNKEDSVSKAVWVEAGLHWNVPVPVEGNDHYLLGPNGKAQPYQYLLPGIWLSINKNKQRLILSANPFVSAPLPNKYYDKGLVSLNDSISVYSQKRMVKMFGYQASLQYGYQFAGHWWLNGGISANWWKKGLVSATSADSLVIYKPFLYSVHTKDENAVTALQLSANAALSYQFKSCEAVLQLNVPFNATRVQSPLWMRVGVRWRLWHILCRNSIRSHTCNATTLQ